VDRKFQEGGTYLAEVKVLYPGGNTRTEHLHTPAWNAEHARVLACEIADEAFGPVDRVWVPRLPAKVGRAWLKTGYGTRQI
jgi:hypothetical protein